jgi:hypothetical protein
MNPVGVWAISWLLQIPLPEQVSKTLDRLLDIPLVFRLVAGFGLVAVLLFAVNYCLQEIDKMLGTGQSIRAKLQGNAPPPAQE